MHRITKLLLVVLALIVTPLKQWAQTPYRQYSNNGVELNFSNIDDVYFRAYLLYNLSQDDRFILTAEDDNGVFYIGSSVESLDKGFFDTFEDVYNLSYTDFQMLSKLEITDLYPIWKSQVNPRYFTSMMMDITLRNSREEENETCLNASPFCTSDFYEFETACTNQSADDLEPYSIDQGCIMNSINPSWYYMRIADAGQFVIHIEGYNADNPNYLDIDFCIWGPYTEEELNSGYACSHLTGDMIIDCSYSASYTEDVYLGYPESEHVHATSHGTVNYHVPQTGEYYLLMVTNFSRQPCTISFQNVENSGSGSTDSSILPPLVSNDGPYCVDETIHLFGPSISGASYSWIGPNNYRSRYQNPSRANCTMAMAGAYICTISKNGKSTSDTTWVEVYPNVNANFTATIVDFGHATQFNSTSTTNPSGFNISSYEWDFGDGCTSSEAMPSHTYAQAGTFQVNLKVSNGGHCNDEITQTVTVKEAIFFTDGNWNDDSCWSGGQCPPWGSDVVIMANAVIPTGYTVKANQVTIADGGSLTIADGGQLKHNTSNLVVTMKKSIEAYSEMHCADNYYLLSFPFETPITVPDAMTAAEGYDFYGFDPSYLNAEWRNNKQQTINTVVGGGTTGYLYAIPEDMELSLTGVVATSYSDSSYVDEKNVIIPYTQGSSDPSNGWALLGNPFTCDAYLYDDENVPMDFMVYNGQGELVNYNCGPIAPMQGFFVKVKRTMKVRILCDTSIYDRAVNPSYVPIDWTNATLLSSNDSIGNYQIQFNGGAPENLYAGSIIAIDQDTLVHYVFVETLTMNGDTVSMTTSEAYLTDIFADTDFTLATNPNSRLSAHGKVFYPIAMYLPDNDGMLHKIDCANGENRNTLWNYGLNFDNTTLLSGENYSVYLERLNFNFTLDLEVNLGFGSRNDSVPTNSGLTRFKSRPRNISAYLVGSFDSELMARCDMEGSCSYSPDYDIWKHNPVSTPNYVFAPYGVPIVVKINSDLYRQVELSASGEISAYTGFTDHAEGRVGFQWHQTDGMIPMANFSNTFGYTPPTVEGQGTVEAKVWVFPRFRLIFYNALGPSFDIKPYLSTTVRGGFKEEMLGQNNDFCAWNLDCKTGIDAACGLSLQFMGYEVQNYSTPNWNITNKPLYHSPKRIELASLDSGQTKTVRFKVYDRNYLSNTDVLTPLPQFVKFESEGELSSEYGIANGGMVSVDWTPSCSSNVMYARLYNIEGNVISEAEVEAECECYPTSGDWVDLGLPSGLLWASHNVGANSPEDFGSYFAWGETQPKSEYSWDTYAYGYDYYDDDGNQRIILTKYNPTNSNQGPVDNLTILLPGDDAATANWGDGARMPTNEEWLELYNNTTSCWVTINGVNGRCFTGSNCNRIFLPAAGYIGNGGTGDFLGDPGYNGHYWSSSLFMNYPIGAYDFNFNSGHCEADYYGSRLFGHSVRAVRSTQN